MNNLMIEATRLTRASRLTEATALIQRMLQGETEQPNASAVQFAPWKHSSNEERHQEFRQDAQKQFVWGLKADSLPDFARPKSTSHVGFSPGDLVPEGGTFVEAQYTNSAGTRAYKLYVPSCYNGQKLPLIIMLHGGTQSADDFAGGTRMNVRAEEENCLVAYPIQPGHANLSKCWNWFRPEDQYRDRGEPSLVAGITHQIIKDYCWRRCSCRPNRYLPGLVRRCRSALWARFWNCRGRRVGLRRNAWGRFTSIQPIRGP
jgi:Esterase PHB depolymerase